MDVAEADGLILQQDVHEPILVPLYALLWTISWLLDQQEGGLINWSP
jgi:hypothetical protein